MPSNKEWQENFDLLVENHYSIANNADRVREIQANGKKFR